MIKAGIKTNVFTAHNAQDASTSAALNAGLTIKQILE